MKHLRILILIPLTLLLTGSVTQQHLMVVARKNVEAPPGGGGIAYAKLAEGTDTSENGTVVTSSVTPTSNAIVILVVVSASTASGTDAQVTNVSGCNLTWTSIGSQVYGSRRYVNIWRGTAASPTTGAITATSFAKDSKYGVFEFTGVDTTTPVSGVNTTSTAGATSLTVDLSGGTVDSGDWVFAAFGIEGGTVSATLEASLTEGMNLGSGTDVRTGVAGYDGTPTIDQSPSVSWTGTESGAGVGFILEVAP